MLYLLNHPNSSKFYQSMATSCHFNFRGCLLLHCNLSCIIMQKHLLKSSFENQSFYHKGRALEGFFAKLGNPHISFMERLNPMKPCRILWLSCQTGFQVPSPNIAKFVCSIQRNHWTCQQRTEILRQLGISIFSNPLKLELDSLS